MENEKEETPIFRRFLYLGMAGAEGLEPSARGFGDLVSPYNNIFVTRLLFLYEN